MKQFTKILMTMALLLVTTLLWAGVSIPDERIIRDETPSTVQIRLLDETGNPVANFTANYRSRCGGSWTYDGVAFTTDADGYASLNTSCTSNNWDGRITLIVNKTSREQVIADNSIYQVAKVNVNLETCNGNALSGGIVAQGGGSWTPRGTTDANGRVSFFAFSGTTVVARMSYNYGQNIQNGVQVLFPETNIDFVTTSVNLQGGGAVQVGSGGWPTIPMPYEMLAGTYNFRINGVQINGVEISGCNFSSSLIRLIDENSNPLGDFDGNYRSRCGGSWTYDYVPFTTNANGYALLNTACSTNNWDGKITVRVNKTTAEQVIASNNIYQLAKVNVNLKTCAGVAIEGAAVEQGSGSWTPRGVTDVNGQNSYYAFPGNNVVARVSFNYGSQTISNVPVLSPVTNIDFSTTKVTLYGPAPIQIQVGGWPTITSPIELLPGTYGFRFGGNLISGVVVSGCEMSKGLLQVKNELNGGVSGATFSPACGGSWQTPISGATDANGNLFADIPPCMTKIRATVGNSSQELTKAQLTSSNYKWTTQVLRVRLLNHAGNVISDGTGSLSQGGGTWIDLGNLDANGSVLVNTFPVSSARYRMTYNCTSEIKNGIAVVDGAGVQVADFQTGQVIGSCTTQYQGCGWSTFVSGMELMPGTRTYRYPTQTVAITAGSVTTLNPCLNVYPSPATSIITLENYDGNIQVFNKNNVQVYNGPVTSIPSTTIDISAWSLGMYVVRTQDGQVFKFFKQ